jgi:hypothetical protein
MKRRSVLVRGIAFVGAIAGFHSGKVKAADRVSSEATTCGIAKGHPQKYIKAAKRLPKLPDRSTISSEELPAYDQIFNRLPTRATGAGSYFHVFCVAPRTGAAISGLGGLGDTLTDYESLPGHFRAIDHQIIDMTLPLDSGYYSLVAGHTPQALAAGIKMQTIEALRDHRDDLIHPDDQQGVEFVRTVRDGKMTDDIWERMKTKLITERAVVEFVHFVLLLEYHHKFSWAVGAPEMALADFNMMLEEFKTGARKIPELRTAAPNTFSKHYSCDPLSKKIRTHP